MIEPVKLPLPNGCMGIQPHMVTRPCAVGVDIRFDSFDVAIADVWPQSADQKVARLVFYGKVRDDKDVVWLCHQYPVSCGVVDCRPEGTLAKRFVEKLRRQRKDFWRAQYNTNPSNVELTVNEKEHLITLERTMTIDNLFLALSTSLGMALPQNWRDIGRAPGQDMGAFGKELMAPTKSGVIWHGMQDFRWDASDGDHATHALNYLLVAIGIGKLHLPRGDALMPMKGLVAGTLGGNMDEEVDPMHREIYGDDDDDSGVITLEA